MKFHLSSFLTTNEACIILSILQFMLVSRFMVNYKKWLHNLFLMQDVAFRSNWVRLNVGGRVFATSR